MTTSRTDLSNEIISLAIFAGTGVLIFFGAADLPAAEMDPLGPAGVPQYIASIILVLSAVRLGALVVSMKRSKAISPRAEPAASRNAVAAAVFALAVAYLLVLTIGGLPFSLVTLVFLTGAGFAMLGFSKRSLPLVLAIAVAMSFGLTFVFSDLLKVILPS